MGLARGFHLKMTLKYFIALWWMQNGEQVNIASKCLILYIIFGVISHQLIVLMVPTLAKKYVAGRENDMNTWDYVKQT